MTANEQLRDEAIAHAIDLQHYSNSAVRRMVALLNATDDELAARIAAALEQAGPAAGRVERLELLLASVRALNAQLFQRFEQGLTAELRDFVDYEAGYQAQLFESAVPPQIVTRVGIASVNVEQVYAAAMARPFQGRLLRSWAEGLGEGRMERVRSAIRQGFVQNETIPQIVQRVRGTKARNFKDGILEIDRRNAEAVVRTAISHTAAVVRDEHRTANSDLVKGQQWLSTLDLRTSSPCRLRDGKRYTNDDAPRPIGHAVPWLEGPGRLHWNCRSSAVDVLKSWRELGIDVDELPPGSRASMDGQVAADTSFSAWIRKQSARRQDEVLGPTRAKLMRDGGMQLEEFYTNRGTELTLAELRKRDPAAFRRAGLSDAA